MGSWVPSLQGKIDQVIPPVDSLLVKLATRCNIACSYCYWFRDATVYEKPPLLTPAAQDALVTGLERHVRRYALDSFRLMFHGGEPLMFGKRRLRELLNRVRGVADRTGCRFSYSIQTNGILIDEAWIALLAEHQVTVGVSLDGPPEINDRYRIDFEGRGTFDRVARALDFLASCGVDYGILTVGCPQQDPARLLTFVFDELGVWGLDILIPDATHEDATEPVAQYFIELFDIWFDAYADRGYRIRLFEEMIKGLLGHPTGTQSIGYGPMTAVTLNTDGCLEPLDVIRIIGDGAAESPVSLLTHELQDICTDPSWRTLYDASLTLAPPCEACEFRLACGGGSFATRWSDANGWNNPSVYCADYKAIFSHVRRRVRASLYAEGRDRDGRMQRVSLA